MPEETVSLKEYFERRLDAIENMIAERSRDVEKVSLLQGINLKEEVKALKELWDRTHNSIEQQMEQKFNGVRQAVTKAEVATERRFEGVNEFRSTLSDQQRSFMPRSEAEALLRGINDKIDEQGKRMTELVSERKGQRLGSTAVWGITAGVIGIVLFLFGIATFFLNRNAPVGG